MRNLFRSGPHLEQPVADQGETKDINKAGQALVVDIKRPIDDSSGIESFTVDAHNGVKKIEATTTLWDKKSLIAAYILMWMIMFGTSGYLITFGTSPCQQHSLTAYIGVMSSIIGGVLKLLLAKTLDIFVRPQGFALMAAYLVIGLVAACNNVQTYAAARSSTELAMSYVISIFIADTSHLKNRAFMFAYVSSPYIVAVWITGPLETAYLAGAVRAGIILPSKSNRSFIESVKYYAIEFDVGGLVSGLVFLLPFSPYSYQDGQWKSAFVIFFLVTGGLMLIRFVLYENFVAPKSFMPFEVLLDRTVLGACIVSGAFLVSFFIWNAYFFSYLTVWIALYFGVPVSMLGVGLLIHFWNNSNLAAMAATTHQYVAVVLAVEGMFSSVGGGTGSSISAVLWTVIFPAKLAEYLPAEVQSSLMAIYADIVTQTSYPKGTPTRITIARAYRDS
ncbi:hypothetical protein BU25DRAFT_432503 [Macroventuria anomochaeta]|uniref:Uncharacterized protein n=1 Tax=Macroventuria anomochaeta TaxID=301207 RepID=A0ACB6RV54_9PLEO|nr:uncharacterized protein BU25DRAFT_432503 [Macroventuria anomochaeta]KAF2625926.1 hypothetical protein BU25DRAFT_432503 [Macroventuria anomochaeta]